MKVLSLFDGISCGMVALERAGIPVERYVAYEYDEETANEKRGFPFGCAAFISQKNYPEIEHYGDVTIADFTQYQGFDFVIGGSPCQGFSFAGKQLNFEDPRSKLFFEYVRAINEVKPKFFLFENTPMKKEYIEVISKYLGFEPTLINSELVSAQERKRLYWVGKRNSDGTYSKIDIEQPEDKHIFLEDIVEPDALVDRDKAHAIIALIGRTTHREYFERSQGQMVFKAIELSNIYGGFKEKKPRVHLNKSVTIRAGQGGGHIPSLVIEDKAKDFTLEDFKKCIRKVTPLECERLQTMPDYYTEGISPTQQYKCIGNGWTVDVIAHIFTHIKENERINEMELKIQNVTFPEVIEFNFEELKAEITAKVESYKNIVYTEEQINLAKTDLANLRKFTKALSDERIKVKNDCLKAYNPFEEKIKVLTAIVNEGIGNIDNQVKDYTEQQKSEKLKKIVEYFNSTEHPEWLYLESIFNDKWLNASVTMKKVEEEINARLEQIAKDLEILSVMPDFSFEATEAYKNTLDVNKAIAEGKRLAEIAKRKAEAEASSEEAGTDMATATLNMQNCAKAIAQKMKETQWISFRAYLSVDDAKALKEFFNSRNIQFEKI